MPLLFTTSWDDGHPLDLKLAELLARFGLTGTFYCPMRNREGLPVMSAHEMRSLDGPFELGSHTHDHVYADRIPATAWQQQVLTGKVALEQAIGHQVEGFCYPGGRLTGVSRDMVEKAGFVYGRTTQNFQLQCASDPLLMPTTLQFYPHTRTVLASNWLRRGNQLQRLRLAMACLAAGQLNDRLRLALKRCAGPNQVFHLWGHSWEIEQQGLWSQLESFFSLVAQTIPPQQRLSNAGVLRALGLLKSPGTL
jgi:peptidoglycan-N-acetylglucosamine deacetylase